MAKTFIGLSFFLLLVLALFIGIKYGKSSVFFDLTEGFVLTNIADWKEAPAQEGAYKSFRTSASYADLRFLPKEQTLDQETMAQIIKEGCQDLVKEPNVTSREVQITDLVKNGQKVIQCELEGINPVNDLPLRITTHYFLSSKNKILVITLSVPLGDGKEEAKAERFLEGLKLL